MEKKVFAVVGMNGSYEDTTSSVIRVYESEDDAKQFIEEQKEYKRTSKELAIDDIKYYNLKQEYSDELVLKIYGYETAKSMYDYPDEFSDGRAQWIYVVKKNDKNLCLSVQKIISDFRDKKHSYPSDDDVLTEIEQSNSFTQDEYRIISDCFSEWEQLNQDFDNACCNEEFIKWLVDSKGYAANVAIASVNVNEYDDMSKYNTYYYIQETKYYEKK